MWQNYWIRVWFVFVPLEHGVPFFVYRCFFQRSRMCLLQKLLPLFATCLEPISKYRIFLCNNLNESTINFRLKFCFGLIPIIQYHFFFEFWICVLYLLNVRKQQIVIYYFCLDWMQFGFGKVNLTIAVSLWVSSFFSFGFVWRVFKVFRLKICLSRKCVNKCFSVFNKYDV